jgi:hypothetical protein
MSIPSVKSPVGFPSCVSLTIEFNQHAVNYQTVQQWESDRGDVGGVDWVSPEERERAFATDSVWECHWYPTTPVGSCSLCASSFEALMAAVNAGAV